MILEVCILPDYGDNIFTKSYTVMLDDVKDLYIIRSSAATRQRPIFLKADI